MKKEKGLILPCIAPLPIMVVVYSYLNSVVFLAGIIILIYLIVKMIKNKRTQVAIFSPTVRNLTITITLFVIMYIVRYLFGLWIDAALQSSYYYHLWIMTLFFWINIIMIRKTVAKYTLIILIVLAVALTMLSAITTNGVRKVQKESDGRLNLLNDSIPKGVYTPSLGCGGNRVWY